MAFFFNPQYFYMFILLYLNNTYKLHTGLIYLRVLFDLKLQMKACTWIPSLFNLVLCPTSTSSLVV